jgi:hypothetical protein
MDENHNVDVVDVACFLESFFKLLHVLFFASLSITRASLHFLLKTLQSIHSRVAYHIIYI